MPLADACAVQADCPVAAGPPHKPRAGLDSEEPRGACPLPDTEAGKGKVPFVPALNASSMLGCMSHLIHGVGRGCCDKAALH